MIGKWHLGTASRDMMPTARGFDYFAGNLQGEEDWFSHFRPAHDPAVDGWTAQGMRRVDVRAGGEQAEWPTPSHWVCPDGADNCRDAFVAQQQSWDESTVWTLDDMIDEHVVDGLYACRELCGASTTSNRVDYNDQGCRDCMRAKRQTWYDSRQSTFIDHVAEAEIKRLLEEHIQYDEERLGHASRVDPNRHTPFFLYLPIMQPHLAYNVDLNLNDDNYPNADAGYNTTDIGVESLQKTHLIDGVRIDWSGRFASGGYRDDQTYAFVEETDGSDASKSTYASLQPDTSVTPSGTYAASCAAPNWNTHSKNGQDYVCNPRMSYEMMMRNVDESIGRIVDDVLKPLDLWDDTIFIMMSDNGGVDNSDMNYYQPNYPFRGSKKSNEEGGLRVPGFVRDRECHYNVNQWHFGGSYDQCVALKNNGLMSHKLMHVTDWYRTILAMARPDIDDLPVPTINNRWGYESIALSGHDFYHTWTTGLYSADDYSPRQGILFAAAPRCDPLMCIVARYRDSFVSNVNGAAYKDSLTSEWSYTVGLAQGGFVTQKKWYDPFNAAELSGSWSERFLYNGGAPYMNAAQSSTDFKCYTARNWDNLKCIDPDVECNGAFRSVQFAHTTNDVTLANCVDEIAFAAWIETAVTSEVLDDIRFIATDFNLYPSTGTASTGNRCGPGYLGDGTLSDSAIGSRSHMIDDVYSGAGARSPTNYQTVWTALDDYHRYWTVGWYEDDNAYLTANSLDPAAFNDLFKMPEAQKNACERAGYNWVFNGLRNDCIITANARRRLDEFHYVSVGNASVADSTKCIVGAKSGTPDSTAAVCHSSCDDSTSCVGFNYNSQGENSGCYLVSDCNLTDPSNLKVQPNEYVQGYRKVAVTLAPTPEPSPSPTPPTLSPTPEPTAPPVPTARPTPATVCRTPEYYGFLTPSALLYAHNEPLNCYGGQQLCLYGRRMDSAGGCCPGPDVDYGVCTQHTWNGPSGESEDGTPVVDGYYCKNASSWIPCQRNVYENWCLEHGLFCEPAAHAHSGVPTSTRRRLAEWGHRFWPCCGAYFLPNPEYEDPRMTCNVDPDYPEYTMDSALQAIAMSENGLQPCVPYQLLIWSKHNQTRIKGSQFPATWNWNHRPNMGDPVVSLNTASAVFSTQEQVTLTATLNGLLSPVMSTEELKGLFYVSHPITDGGGDLFQGSQTSPDNVYDGLEMCQHGMNAPFVPLVVSADEQAGGATPGFDPISFHVDLLQCAQRYEYQEIGSCACVWDEDASMYQFKDPPNLPENCLAPYVNKQCAWKAPDCASDGTQYTGTEQTDCKRRFSITGDPAFVEPWKEPANRVLHGTFWHFQFNFVHCMVPDDGADHVGDDLLAWISLFSDDNRATAGAERDALSQMFPNFYGTGEPITRSDMYYGSSFLSNDFQAVLYDWAINGCGQNKTCTVNPFSIAPYNGDDSFIYMHDQRCFNVQVPVRVAIPFDSNPLTSTDGIEFAIGDMINLGAVTRPPTTSVPGGNEFCETELTSAHIDADSCYHTPRPNYNDDDYIPGSFGYAAPYTIEMCNGLNVNSTRNYRDLMPLWYKNIRPTTPSTTDFSFIEFGTQYLGYPFRYDFWVNRVAAANAVDGCESPYELLDGNMGVSDYELDPQIADVDQIRNATGGIDDDRHGVLIEYLRNGDVPIRYNRYVLGKDGDCGDLLECGDYQPDAGFDFDIDMVCNDGTTAASDCTRTRPPTGRHSYNYISNHGWSVKGRTWEPNVTYNEWVGDDPPAEAATLWSNIPVDEARLRTPMCMHPLTVCRLHMVFTFGEFVNKKSAEYSPITARRYTENTYYESAVGKVVWYRDIGNAEQVSTGFNNMGKGQHVPTLYVAENELIPTFKYYLESPLGLAPDETWDDCDLDLPYLSGEGHDDKQNCRAYLHFGKAEPFMITHDSWHGHGSSANDMFTERKFELRRLIPYSHVFDLGVNTSISKVFQSGAEDWTGIDLREYFHEAYAFTPAGARQQFDAIRASNPSNQNGPFSCRGHAACPSYVLAADAVEVSEDYLHVLPRNRKDGDEHEDCTGINPDGTGQDDRNDAYGAVNCNYQDGECTAATQDLPGCKHSLCREADLQCWSGTRIDVTWGFPSCTPKHVDWWADGFDKGDLCSWDSWFAQVDSANNVGEFSQFHDVYRTSIDADSLSPRDLIGEYFGSLRPCRDTSDCYRWYAFNKGDVAGSTEEVVGAELFTVAENEDYHPSAGEDGYNGDDPTELRLPKYFNYKPVCSTRLTGGSLPGINGWDYSVDGMPMSVGDSSDFLTLNDRRALDWFDEQRHKLNDGVTNRKAMKFCSWYSEDLQQAKELLRGKGTLLDRDTWTDQFYGGAVEDKARRSMTRPEPTECYGGCVRDDSPVAEIPNFDSEGRYVPPIADNSSYLLPEGIVVETYEGALTSATCGHQDSPNKYRSAVDADECYSIFLNQSGAVAGETEAPGFQWIGVTHGEHRFGCHQKVLLDGTSIGYDTSTTAFVNDRVELCLTDPTGKHSIDAQYPTFYDYSGTQSCNTLDRVELTSAFDCSEFAKKHDDKIVRRIDRRDRGRCIHKDGVTLWNPYGSTDACGAGGWRCVCYDALHRRRLSTARQLEVVVTVTIDEDSSEMSNEAYAYSDVECLEQDWQDSIWLCMQDFVFHPTDLYFYTVGDQSRVRIGTTSNLVSAVQDRLDLCIASSNSLCDVGDEVSDAFLWYAVGGLVGFFCLLVPLAIIRRRKDDGVTVVRRIVPRVDLEALDTFVEKLPLVSNPERLRTPSSWY